MHQNINFEFEGEKYEVRVLTDGSTTRIRVFKGDKPANGYSYTVELDPVEKWLVDPVEEMVDTAIKHVKDKTWEQCME